MKARLVVLILISLSVVSCPRGKPRHEDFLRQFIASVIDDTDFHRQHLYPDDKTDLAKFRPFMSKDFEIFLADIAFGFGEFYGKGIYEYGLCFASDTPCFVTIEELGGNPKYVSLDVWILRRCDWTLKIPPASTEESVGEPAGP